MAERSPETFEAVDWASVSRDRRRLPAGVRFVFPLALVVVAFAVTRLTAVSVPVVSLRLLDWLLIASAAILVPITRVVARQASLAALASDPRTAVSLAWVGVFVAAGALAPLAVSEGPPNILIAGQPPVWASVDAGAVPECAGPVVDDQCLGTWQHPLGTSPFTGRDQLTLILLSARTALTVAAGAATLIVPVGVGIGATAATVGGRVDDLLMWLAESLQSLPAILVYVVFFYWILEGRLALLVALLGLVGWGGVARVVRSEMLELERETYVQAARIGGVGRLRLIWNHLLPNVLPTVAATALAQAPLFMLMEASVSFIRVPGSGASVTMGDPAVFSWGQLARRGAAGGWPTAVWFKWIPMVLLATVVVAFVLASRGVIDTLQPER